MNDGRGEMRLLFPGEPRYVPHARRAVLEVCRGEGWRGRPLQELGLALTEIANNALEHGSGSNLRLHLEVRPERVVLRVAGGRADRVGELRRALEASGELPEDESDRGRGLYLVRACVDRLQVRTAGPVVVVRMVKERARRR